MDPFSSVDQVLGVLARKGPAPGLPLSEEEYLDPSVRPDWDHGIRIRLMHLGHLFTPGAHPASAIRTFQEENGLDVDGWIGPTTWTGLLGATAVEKPLRPSDWTEVTAASPASLRRTRLRLRRLGFLENHATPADVPGALTRFERCATDLGALAAVHEERDVVDLLFDHRRLFGALDGWTSLASVGNEPIGDLGRMVARLVQWELFLSGEPVPSSSSLGWRLGPVIAAYWAGLSDPSLSRPTGRRLRKVTPEFIRSLRADDVEPPGGEGLDIETLATVVQEEAPRVKDAVDDVRRSPIFSWESAGRSLRWLWNRARRMGKGVVEGTRTLLQTGGTALVHAARWLVRRASDAATSFREAIQELSGLFGDIGVPGKSTVEGPPWADKKIWLSDPEDAAAARATTEKLLRRNARLEALSEILGIAIRVASDVMVGPAGWVRVAAEIARIWETARHRVQALNAKEIG